MMMEIRSGGSWSVSCGCSSGGGSVDNTCGSISIHNGLHLAIILINGSFRLLYLLLNRRHSVVGHVDIFFLLFVIVVALAKHHHGVIVVVVAFEQNLFVRHYIFEALMSVGGE